MRAKVLTPVRFILTPQFRHRDAPRTGPGGSQVPEILGSGTTTRLRSFTDPTSNPTTPYRYRVVAQNTVGYGGAFPALTASSTSPAVGVNTPAAPTTLAATLQAGPRVSLTWRDNAGNESGFVVERSADAGATFTQLATAPARSSTGGTVTYVDTTPTLGATYVYRVTAVNAAGASGPAQLTVTAGPPAAPTDLTGTAARQGNNERLTLRWTDVADNETSQTVQWSTSATFATVAGTGTAAADATTFTTGTIARQQWYVRVRATNPLGSSAWSATLAVAPAP
jgi:fibronectin type 3 domain-containing protein